MSEPERQPLIGRKLSAACCLHRWRKINCHVWAVLQPRKHENPRKHSRRRP